MSEDLKPAASGEPAGSSKTPEQKGAATLAELSPELQAEITKLVTRKEKEWEKSHSDKFTKASEYDKFLKEQEEKKNAELPEIEKLKKLVDELSPYKSRTEEYETDLKAIVEARFAQIPDDKKGMFPVDYPIAKQLKWLNDNEKLLFGIDKPLAPAGGKGPTGGDNLMLEAEARVRNWYPRVSEGSEDWKRKVDRQYSLLKAASAS